MRELYCGVGIRMEERSVTQMVKDCIVAFASRVEVEVDISRQLSFVLMYSTEYQYFCWLFCQIWCYLW